MHNLLELECLIGALVFFRIINFYPCFTFNTLFNEVGWELGHEKKTFC